MDSPLVEKIRRAICADGTVAVEALCQALLNHLDEVEIGEEILQQIGLLRDKPTAPCQAKTTHRYAGVAQERIRDATSLGISFMKDPAALPHLYDARQSELAPWVAERF